MSGVFLRGVCLLAGLVLLAGGILFGLRQQTTEILIASEIVWNTGELSPKEWFYDRWLGSGRRVDHLEGEAYREMYSPGGGWQFWVVPDMQDAARFQLNFRNLTTGETMSEEVRSERDRTSALQIVWSPADQAVLWRFRIENVFDLDGSEPQPDFQVLSLTSALPSQGFPIPNIRNLWWIADNLIWQEADGTIARMPASCLEIAPLSCDAEPVINVEETMDVLALSPDAQTAYAVMAEETDDIFMDPPGSLAAVDLQTGTTTLLQENIDLMVKPVLSPDGHWLAAARVQESEEFSLETLVDVLLISTETGVAEVVAEGGVNEFVWSADSRQLAYEVAGLDDFLAAAIWVYDRETGLARQLSPDGEAFYSPHWRSLTSDGREMWLGAFGLGGLLLAIGLWRHKEAN